MTGCRPLLRILMALLIAATAIGRAGLASACAESGAPGQDGAPCCPMCVQHSPDAASGCMTALVRTAAHGTFDCDLAPCNCSTQIASVQAIAPEVRTVQVAPSLAAVWVPAPVRAHWMPPPSAPPRDVSSLPAGRHTYLDTLRLRI